MFKIKAYLYTEIVPIAMASLLFLFYKKVICHVAVSTNSESNFRFICEFKWKDGVFLLSSYCITAVAFSHGSARLASGSDDKTVNIRDTPRYLYNDGWYSHTTNRIRTTFNGHASPRRYMTATQILCNRLKLLNNCF